MANGASTNPPGLALPHSTFAKLTPAPYLHAHLKQKGPIRPNGRKADDFREPIVTYGSLTHANGSALVRTGDTVVVCGVRAEVLLASDIAQPPARTEDGEEDDEIEGLGLLVPNLELSTGCSPAHLPGNPPSARAQALTYRIYTLLRSSNLLRAEDLRITYTSPETDDDLPDAGAKVETRAYWTLYIDILCLSLDGNVFDTAWASVIAALKDTKLAKAWWDADHEAILCSPLVADARGLSLRDATSLPMAATFAVFSTATPLKAREEARSWVLADPDAFEEEVCRESVTVAVAGEGGEVLIRVEKNGGGVVGGEEVRKCVGLARERWGIWEEMLKGG